MLYWLSVFRTRAVRWGVVPERGRVVRRWVWVVASAVSVWLAMLKLPPGVKVRVVLCDTRYVLFMFYICFIYVLYLLSCPPRCE